MDEQGSKAGFARIHHPSQEDKRMILYTQRLLRVAEEQDDLGQGSFLWKPIVINSDVAQTGLG